MLDDNDRTPRRPLDHMTLASISDDERLDQHYFEVVGQFPVPPCIVFCPKCGMPSYVEPPDASPPTPQWDEGDLYMGYGWEQVDTEDLDAWLSDDTD